MKTIISLSARTGTRKFNVGSGSVLYVSEDSVSLTFEDFSSGSGENQLLYDSLDEVFDFYKGVDRKIQFSRYLQTKNTEDMLSALKIMLKNIPSTFTLEKAIRPGYIKGLSAFVGVLQKSINKLQDLT